MPAARRPPRSGVHPWSPPGSGVPEVPQVMSGLDHLLFRNGDGYQYWTTLVMDPIQRTRARFATLVLRPDGLLIDHVVPSWSVSSLSSIRLPAPGALYGTEPNLTLSLGYPDLFPGLTAARRDELFPFMPFARLSRGPRGALDPIHLQAALVEGVDPAFSLGVPYELELHDDSFTCLPDRLAPLREGSLIRGGATPDTEFLEALLLMTRSLQGEPTLLEHSLPQAVAALGAGVDPPLDDRSLIGCWPPDRAGPPSAVVATLVVSLVVVGSRGPHLSGFVRGTLPSGWILFQRRSPTIHPRMLNDYGRFIRLMCGFEGELRLVTGTPSRVLSEPFLWQDVEVSSASPLVPAASP